jgi:hypothetical protein
MIRPPALLSLVSVGAAPVAAVSLGDPSEAVEAAAHESSVDVRIGGRPFTTFFFDSSEIARSDASTCTQPTGRNVRLGDLRWVHS